MVELLLLLLLLLLQQQQYVPQTLLRHTSSSFTPGREGVRGASQAPLREYQLAVAAATLNIMVATARTADTTHDILSLFSKVCGLSPAGWSAANQSAQCPTTCIGRRS